MRRPARVLLLATATIAVSGLAVACGTEKISAPKTNAAVYHGAVLFSQRCAGCHTLSYAATNGSAVNVRTAQANNGPNFNVRCERPAARVLYAIENGGFSGAIMPQNVVVGQDAIDVAEFVATYAGRQAPSIPGVAPCTTKSVDPVVPVVTTTSTTASKARGRLTSKQKAAARLASHTQGHAHAAAP